MYSVTIRKGGGVIANFDSAESVTIDHGIIRVKNDGVFSLFREWSAATYRRVVSKPEEKQKSLVDMVNDQEKHDRHDQALIQLEFDFE